MFDLFDFLENSHDDDDDALDDDVLSLSLSLSGAGGISRTIVEDDSHVR